MASSFCGCSSGRGTTIERVLQLSINFEYSGCCARLRIPSQNLSASGHESSSASTEAVDVPSEVPARSWSRKSVCWPFGGSLLRFSRLRSMASGRSRKKATRATAVARAKKPAINPGRANSRRRKGTSARSSSAAPGTSFGAPRAFSYTARNAGTSRKVPIQQSSMPMPPMIPKCRKPRFAAMISVPNETLVAAEASSVASAVLCAPSTQAGSSSTPRRRSCFTRAR